MKRSPVRLAVTLSLIAAGAACKKTEPPTPTGAGSGGPVIIVGSGSGSGSAPADASSPDASGIGFATTITPDGVGPITAKTPPTTVASLFPGLEVEHDIQETEASKAEYFNFSKSTQPVLSVVVDDFTDANAIFKVVITDPMFATATGIGVSSTIMDLAKKHPDTKCYFEKYDAEADAERVEQRLFCEAASLPRLSFQLAGEMMKGKPGEVGLNVLARQAITQIVWLPGARVTVPTGSLGTITPTAVGPITATTPTTVEAIKQLLPTLEVATEAAVINVTRKDNPVLAIGIADKGASSIRIFDSGFATASGIAVGSTVAQLAAKETGVTCQFDAPELALTCVAKSQPTLRFAVAVGNFKGKDGASVPTKTIGTRKVEAITWKAR
ncbi:MAG: hypothetical protein H0T79_01010 [Deltaproteobacteria bacterium]|nr:hypothetical protein [Deltaproteobacteria bacterium]